MGEQFTNGKGKVLGLAMNSLAACWTCKSDLCKWMQWEG